MQKQYKGFQDLELWQKAREYKMEIYRLIKTFPNDEKFNLTNQLIRSVRSIAANIAEGYGRFTYKDQIHFCIQARGSLYETLNHIIDAYDSKYISIEDKNRCEEKAIILGKYLNGYISWLKSMIDQNKLFGGN